ncbi:MAG: glycosyltransferase family 4 protein [Candidatus Riflebacteria bacterium]|nr:glycosyltransferase family 4 protein [Candidatus Riflebacteria bacterium]
MILFGPLPGIVNGHTLAFRCLIEGLKDRGIGFSLVDYSTHLLNGKGAGRSLWRIAEYFRIIFRFLLLIVSSKRTVVYITLNQALDGAVRDFFLIVASKLCGHSVVVHIHGGMYDRVLNDLPAFLRPLMLRALEKCSKIIILSDYLRKMFSEYPGISRRLAVVKNGLPFDLIGDACVEGKNIERKSRINLLFLSNMIETKGWEETLQAVKILVHEKKIDILARFCGPFQIMPGDIKYSDPVEARAAFDKYISENSLSSHVEYIEFADEKTKDVLLRQTHFMVFPSRYPNEGQPLVLIEGLAYGCVLIATDYRAIPDMVIPGKSGVLTSSDPCEIADSIFRLVENPRLYETLSRGALELFNSSFTRKKHVECILEILKK